MTDDDKLIKSMFDGVVETSVKPDGEVEVKLVSPSAEEMEEAVADFVRSWREYRLLDPMRYGEIGWWKTLQYLAISDDRLKEYFCGRDRSPSSIKRYHVWKLHLADGRRYKTDC